MTSATPTYLADLSMVTLCSLCKERLVLREPLLVGEGDTVYSLQRVVLGVTQEV